MQRRTIITVIAVVFGLALWFLLKHSIDQPVSTTPPPSASLAPEAAPAEIPDIIIVSTPLPESTVGASTIVIKGRARGTWFFEASAPVTIMNWDGLIIGEGVITVDPDYNWMTTEFVPFTGKIAYTKESVGPYTQGWINIKKDNLSGEAQLDQALEFKIYFPSL